MRTPKTTRPDLRAQNSRLRNELHELRETLRAIREDAVDAFVVETAHGPQIFMLQELAADSSVLRDEILAKISDAVIVYGDDTRVLYLNAAAENLYGVTPSDALGGLIDGIFRVRWFHPADAAHADAALQGSGRWSGVCVHVTRTGEVMVVEVTVSALNTAATQSAVWLVTTHKATGASVAATHARLETQARELRRWEAIGALAARVADDAIAILGPSEAVEMGPVDLGTASHRAHELGRQLHALDESRARQRPLVSVATIISEVARLLRIGLPEQIAVKIDCAATTPLIQADAIQLIQSLLNLGSNAAHAMAGRPGTLEIRADEIIVTETMVRDERRLRSGRFVRIAVSDTGSGMDAETLRRAFEPYFSQPPGQGVGLGLTRVLDVVEAHEGIMLVRSAPDIGSTFELYLPCVV